IIKSAHNQPVEIEEKISYADLVTITDKQVESLLKSRILEKYPDHKQAQTSVVYNPITEQMFHAERGKGAFLNVFILLPELHNALILTDWGGDRNAANLDTKCANIRRLISDVRG
ncbi:unnamed protein product, partial [Dibothriocephalus latus]